MYEISNFLDFFTKLLYGTHLSLAFSGVTFSKNKKDYLFALLVVTLLQNLSFFILGEEITIQIYPFLIHLPIILFLNKKMNIRFPHAFLSLILAFQLISPRAWFGGVITYFGIHNLALQNIVKVIVSAPLAFFISKYISPPIARLKDDLKIMILVSLAPYLYYISTYIFSIYSLIVIEDTQILLKIADAWFVLVFLAYTIVSIYVFEEKNKLDMEKTILLKMQNHTKIELAQLHNQNEIEQIHRHDLRHHGNYILNLLPKNTNPEIIDYINSVLITQDLKSPLYSNNQSLNLLLNFYRKKSDEMNVSFSVEIGVEDFGSIIVIDLCSLLSNGLENALNATSCLNEDCRKISLKIYSKEQNLWIDLRNSFSKQPVFVNTMPISQEEQHGYGTKSMVKICEKYNGITRFCIVDNEFCFQAVLSKDIN